MSKEEIEQVLIKYINHVSNHGDTNLINEYYLLAAGFTKKEKEYLIEISKQKQK